MFKKTKVMICMVLIIGLTGGCKDFLEEKPDISINIPETLKDLRLMLDDATRINQSTPGLIELGSDDYEVDYAVLTSRPVFEQQVYLWDPNPMFQLVDITAQWLNAYHTVLIANVVLESLDRITEGSSEERGQLQGEALFIRSFAYFMLAQIYCDPFDPNGENDGPGIPFRPSSDPNEPSIRPSIAEVYQRILDDLQTAYNLLPQSIVYKTRPGKQAALALLARVYLSMEWYDRALEHAQLALQHNDILVDFNTLPVLTTNPFKPMSDEVIYYSLGGGASLITASRSQIPMDLYDSYAEEDLRRTVYFRQKSNGKYVFKGGYSGSTVIVFTGLVTDELYFIKAECQARLDRLEDACNTINHLLRLRWETDTYVDISSTDRLEVLTFILDERRKGLLMRGLRWSDLRRLNRDDNFKTTLVRRFDDNDLRDELPPNDLRYTYLIPEDVIQLTGFEQNKR